MKLPHLTPQQRHLLSTMEPRTQQHVIDVLASQRTRVSRREREVILALDRHGWLRQPIADLLERHINTIDRYVNAERRERYLNSEAGKHERLSA